MWDENRIEFIYKYKNRIKQFSGELREGIELFYDITYKLFDFIHDIATLNCDPCECYYDVKAILLSIQDGGNNDVFNSKMNEMMQKMRAIPIKLELHIQTMDDFIDNCGGKLITLDPSNSGILNPIEIDNFENPFSWDETLEKIKVGGFIGYDDFMEMVLRLQTHDKEKYKTWWLEDASKGGALKILGD